MSINIHANTYNPSIRYLVQFRVYVHGHPIDYEVKGQVAKTICALVDNGKSGVTALEMSSWALRLARYVSALRHDYNLEIETVMEPHSFGRHARYVLQSAVEIISIDPIEVCQTGEV